MVETAASALVVEALSTAGEKSFSGGKIINGTDNHKVSCHSALRLISSDGAGSNHRSGYKGLRDDFFYSEYTIFNPTQISPNSQ
jgi:hypothetical protein